MNYIFKPHLGLAFPKQPSFSKWEVMVLYAIHLDDASLGVCRNHIPENFKRNAVEFFLTFTVDQQILGRNNE
jgi:hypothetical protein